MIRALARLLRTDPAVIALSFARMADALGNSLLILVLPLYVHARPAPLLGDLPREVLVGLVIGLYGLLFAGAQPFTGWLADRVASRRHLVLGGLLGMAAATLAFTWAEQYLSILLLRALQGLAVAVLIPASLVLISNASEGSGRGNAMGIYAAFRMVGFASGPLLGGWLVVTQGFGAAFAAGTVAVLVAFLVVVTVVREEAAPARPREQQGGDPPPRRGLDRTLLALGLASVVLASSLSMIAALEEELNRRLDQTALGFGVAFSALTVSRLVVEIPTGRLSDRIGRKPLIVAGLVALAPITVAFAHVGSTWQLVTVRVVQGLAAAGIAAPAFALAGDIGRRTGSPGRTLTVVTTGFGLGLAAGPLAAGVLAGYASFEAPFYVVGACAGLAALTVAVAAREPARRGDR